MTGWKKRLRQLAPQAVRIAETVRDDRTASRAPRMTPNGFKLAGNPAMEAGTFEPEETRIMGRLLEQVDVMVNVGANVGYYCCQALRRGLYTVAVEPLPVNVRLLLANIRANGWEGSAEIHPVALSETNGILELFGSGTGASLIPGWANNSGNGGVLVPVMRLDDLLGQRFADKRLLIVVDVEGVEDAMLAGAALTLARSPRPIWMVEITVDDHQPAGRRINPTLAATFERFWAHGYRAWTCSEPSRLVEREEIERIVATGQSTVATHNFVFSDAGVAPF